MIKYMKVLAALSALVGLMVILPTPGTSRPSPSHRVVRVSSESDPPIAESTTIQN